MNKDLPAPITPNNCDINICYSFATGEIVVYCIEMDPKELTPEKYHKAMVDVGNWIVKGAIGQGIIQESSKRTRDE